MSRRRYTPEEKAEILRKFRRSGVGAAAFCRGQKLSYGTFLKWRREAADGRMGRAESTQFVELEVVGKGAEVEDCPMMDGAGPAVELVMGGGMILRIYPGKAKRRP